MNWVVKAACRDSKFDPDWWWGEEESDEASNAIGICSICPVQPDCLELALKNNEYQGIWGGLTPKQRMRVRSYSYK
jgi:WhiB family redox-sensing transcriptional regulator